MPDHTGQSQEEEVHYGSCGGVQFTSSVGQEGDRRFYSSAEALLSPILLKPDLTQEECDLIAEYVKTLSQSKRPWSKSLPIKYT